MKHLAFGPGAMGYFMYLGALSALSDASALNELVSISGASAGALLGFVYILARGDVQKALDYSLSVPVKTVMKPNIKVLLKSFGLVSSKKVRGVFAETVRLFMKKDDVTFAELYAHWPVKLHVAACCIDLHTTHYFSVDTAPSMSVLDAVCMSISIPFLFQSMQHGPWRYIDGGTLEAIPCGQFIGHDPKTVLAFSIGDEWKSDVKDLKSYALCILGAAMTLRDKYRMFPQIHLYAGELDTFDFSAPVDTKLRLFMEGHAQAKKSLCKVNANDPACCVHTSSAREDDSRQVGDDQEPGSAGTRTQDAPDAQGGNALDVGLLDSGVSSGASQRARSVDQDGWSVPGDRSPSPQARRASDQAESAQGVAHVPEQPSVAAI
jgi:predicted acylesterase/phospholipase RssA